jgi:hypothetical protein
MDAVTGQFLDEDTQPGYPLIPPADDRRWCPCVVEMHEGDIAHLTSFPRKNKNYPLKSVSGGDSVAIQPCIRFGNWVAARVNQQIGWLNTSDMTLTPLAADDKAKSVDNQETDPAQKLIARINATGNHHRKGQMRLTEGEYRRIQRFMRGIMVTLRMANRRNDRQDE